MARETSHVELRPRESPRRLSRPSGFETASVSVGLHGDVVRLLIGEENNKALRDKIVGRGKTLFGKSRTDLEYSAIISISGRSQNNELSVSGMTATFPLIELLPDGEILVVAPRCRRYPDGTHELNAKVYDHAGLIRRDFLLGDGISHVQTDAEGNLWVGY